VGDGDFAGACSAYLCRRVMAIRPEALPTDMAALTQMVLALDADNEKLRVAMQTLKDMIFGPAACGFLPPLGGRKPDNSCAT
jgi:hypothetical protein